MGKKRKSKKYEKLGQKGIPIKIENLASGDYVSLM